MKNTLKTENTTILKVFTQHNEDFEKQMGKMKSKSTYQKYCIFTGIFRTLIISTLR